MRKRPLFFLFNWMVALVVAACLADVAVDLVTERASSAPNTTLDVAVATGIITVTTALATWLFNMTRIFVKLYTRGAYVIYSDNDDDDFSGESRPRSLFTDHHNEHGEYQ
jgi:hypothetical protein